MMAAEDASNSGWSITRAPDGSLVCTFSGPTRSDEFRKCLAALTASMPRSGARLIFDWRQVVGYNPETKEAIKTWLLEHKLSVDDVVAVVPQAKPILKMVVAAVSLAVGVRIKVREAPADAAQSAQFARP